MRFRRTGPTRRSLADWYHCCRVSLGSFSAGSAAVDMPADVVRWETVIGREGGRRSARAEGSAMWRMPVAGRSCWARRCRGGWRGRGLGVLGVGLWSCRVWCVFGEGVVVHETWPPLYICPRGGSSIALSSSHPPSHRSILPKDE